MRIEDIDPPRQQPGATDSILRALDSYGFEWDGEVIYQSRSHAAHLSALESLREQGLAYPCGCSRRDLAEAPRGPLGTIYPGTCRAGCTAPETAIRLRTSDEPVRFDDVLQGPCTHRLESESGDFVIRRRDGLIAYQLAVAVDDELQGITEVVRGIDILDSTPRQLYLQQLLGYRSPDYCHIPVICHADGDKLSKLTGAPGIPTEDPAPVLVAALAALRQAPPRGLAAADTGRIWQWAIENWAPEALRGHRSISVETVRQNVLTATPYLP